MKPRDRQRGRSRTQPGGRIIPAVVLRGRRFDVCLVGGGRIVERVGSVGVALARDARRYGDDLVANLLDRARRHLERNPPLQDRVA